MILKGSVRPFKPSSRILPLNCATLDTETRGLYGEVELICIKVFRGKLCGEPVIIKSDENGSARDKFQTEILTSKWRGMHFYVHNVEFDLTKLFGNVFKHPDFIVLNAGSRFIKLTYYQGGREKKRYPIHFVDTYNLWVAPLAEIGEDLGYEKGITPNKFLADKGGVPNWDPKKDLITETDIKYCLRDCEITQKVVETMAELLTPFNVGLKLTAGACAKAVFKSIAFNDWYNYDAGLDETARDAYYGGRTEVFNNAHTTGTSYGYDINSSYPAQMKNERFPDPTDVKYCSPKAYNELIHDMEGDHHKFEGWANLIVEVPNMDIPPLPYRHDNKLIFPVGTMTGTWCFPELRNAIAQGCKILKCNWIVAGHGIDSPFTEFIDSMYSKKSEAKKNGNNAIAELYKRLMNALSGKMGQRVPIMNDVVQSMEEVPDNMPFDGFDGVFILRNIPKERSEETFVQWVAYITSYARVQLYEGLINGDALYCDTDSVYTTDPFPDEMIDPLELGKWDKEHELSEWWFVAPKRYIYTDLNTSDVTRKQKGVPKEIVESIPAGTFGYSQTLNYHKPVKSKTGLRRGLEPFSKEDVFKHFKDTDNSKRVFHADGTSRPIHISIELP